MYMSADIFARIIPFLQFMASSHFPFFSFIYFTFLLTLCPPASSISFEFTRFDNEQVISCKPGTGGICLQGDAMILSSHVIQLTRNDTSTIGSGALGPNSVGRVTYSDPILLWDNTTNELTNFTTHFSFFMKANTSSGTYYGDGMAFFLSPYPSKLPSDPGKQLLGLFDNTTTQDYNANAIVAVEFDTWDRDGWDPNGAHVGIDVNSIMSKVTTTSITSLNDGRIANAWVRYDSTTFNLSVFLTYQANLDISNLRSCLSYIVDLRKILPGKVAVGFSSSSYKSKEVHDVLSWSFTSNLEENKTKPVGDKNFTNPSTPKSEKEDKNGQFLKIGASVAVVVVVVLIVVICWLSFKLCRRKEKKKVTAPDNQEFSYNSLRAATNSFSADRRLGAGGSGEVYRGFLPDLGIEVAIKRFSKESTQGQKAFEAEVNIISSLRHRNLVKLLGWCHDNEELLLVYELMPNQSLDYWLFGTGQNSILPWSYRYNIALGLASALHYLHEEWEKCVVHRDIKSSNVMLDSNFNARLGDFGLARLTDHGVRPKTTTLFGTIGYMAPECCKDGKSSKESDMYSFGVVLLEIASGRRASEVRLVDWVRNNHQNQTLSEVVDEKMDLDDVGEEQVKRLILVGLLCSNDNPSLRPSIKKTIPSLDIAAPLPLTPVREHVSMDNSSSSAQIDLFPSTASSSHS